METIHEEKRNGLTIKIYPDEDPQSPITDWDDLVTFACFHPRYDLSNTDRFATVQEACEYVKETKAVAVQLYLYDHSGITMSTSPFNCPWDSGLVGIAFIERDKALYEWSAKRLTKRVRNKARDFIKGAVATFDQYLQGGVMGYVVENEDGEHIDSCWGFYGDLDDVLDYARDEADAQTEAKRTEHMTRVKAWIRNRVPLAVRQPCPA